LTRLFCVQSLLRPGATAPPPPPALSNATAPAAAATTHDAATVGDADDDEDEEAVGPACETLISPASRASTLTPRLHAEMKAGRFVSVVLFCVPDSVCTARRCAMALYLCLLVTSLSSTKMAKRVELFFGIEASK